MFAQNYSLDTLMQLNPVLWTLTIEVAFYAALPLLARVGLQLGPNRVALHAAFLLALVAATIAWYWLDYANDWGEIPRKTLPAYIGHFALGMLAALWVERRRVLGGDALGAARTFALMAGGAATVVLIGVWQEHGPPGTLAQALFATLAAAVGFALIVAAAAAGRGPATTWLRSRRDRRHRADLLRHLSLAPAAAARAAPRRPAAGAAGTEDARRVRGRADRRDGELAPRRAAVHRLGEASPPSQGRPAQPAPAAVADAPARA